MPDDRPVWLRNQSLRQGDRQPRALCRLHAWLSRWPEEVGFCGKGGAGHRAGTQCSAQHGVAGWSTVLSGAQELTSWSQPLLRTPSAWGCGLQAAVLGQSCRGALL